MTERGICWSTSQNPTTANSHTTDGSGTGTFVSYLTGLTVNTLYYVRAYATNSVGTAYGNELTFDDTYYIGKSFGGGIIFYVDVTYQHGFIAAPSDQSTGAQWGCSGTLVGACGTAIGTGQANTTAIVNGCSTPGIAARICDDLILNSYSDWFLPSLWELGQMSDFQGYIGGFNGGTYWSSSEYDIYSADFMVFSTSTGYFYTKYGSEKVRAVRAF